MKKLLGIAAGLCLSLAASVGAQPAPSAQQQIQAVMAAMGSAAKAHDTDRFMAGFLHEPSLIFAINGRIIHGWDALHAQQLKWWRNGKSDVVYKPTGPTEFVQLAPGAWVSTQALSSQRTGADGKPSVGTFAVTDIWKKTAQGWRIVYGHESWAKPFD
ncbi:MAG TPA: nuclear transport factor 2 family protein [Rhodanobacteraceae bacterium]|jgi:ketosteroid isomerase-like protein